jgi:hypothetical protein
MTVARRDVPVRPLEELAGAGELPTVVPLEREILEAPFVYDFRVEEAQQLRFQLRDTLFQFLTAPGYDHPTYVMRLLHGDRPIITDSAGPQLADLEPGDYRLVVDDLGAIETNFPAKAFEATRNVSVRRVLPGLLLLVQPVEPVAYREGEDPITEVPGTSEVQEVSVVTVPSIHFVEVSGDQARDVRMEVITDDAIPGLCADALRWVRGGGRLRR